jgi:kynureninase
MDELAARWRPEFPIVDTCTYLVSHSLGAMPASAAAGVQEFLDSWNRRGVRAWSEGWWDIGRETGNLLAPILGVPPGTVTMHQNVTAIQAIVASCHRFDGLRRKIVISELDFPTNLYLYEGFRRYGADVVTVPSSDPVRLELDRFLDAIDETTALVPISLVLFKSAAIVDAAPIVEKAHRVGARVVLDTYQAAGAVPMQLEALGVDFAVGGSVKWLCGGPGAAYLYVRPDLIRELEPGIAGWAAHAEPFQFEAAPIRYADDVRRFQSGTPNVPALYAARAGYRIVGEIGVDAIRQKSLTLTRLLMDLARASGYGVHTPERDVERGGSVVVDVPNGAAATEELIRRDVIVDYRPNAGIRIAPHFYNTEEEITHAMAALDEIVAVAR